MKSSKQWFQLFAGAAVILLATGCGLFEHKQAQAPAAPPPGASQTVLSATGVIQDFASPAGRIPQVILEKASGVAIVPNLTRAAFLVGGEHGNGVMVRHENGQWGLPVFMSLSGGSLGFQVGVTSTDLVLVFMNPASIAKVESGNVTLGVNLTLVAGPVGGAGNIDTKGADVLAYKHTGGVFGGVALKGSRLSLSPNTTYAYYIRPNETQARGYYGEGGVRLDRDLLSLKQPYLQNVPYDARLLQEKLVQLSAPAVVPPAMPPPVTR